MARNRNRRNPNQNHNLDQNHVRQNPTRPNHARQNNQRMNMITVTDRHDFEAIAQYLQHKEVPMSEIDTQRFNLTIPSSRTNDVRKEVSRLNGTITEFNRALYEN